MPCGPGERWARHPFSTVAASAVMLSGRLRAQATSLVAARTASIVALGSRRHPGSPTSTAFVPSTESNCSSGEVRVAARYWQPLPTSTSHCTSFDRCPAAEAGLRRSAGRFAPGRRPRPRSVPGSREIRRQRTDAWSEPGDYALPLARRHDQLLAQWSGECEVPRRRSSLTARVATTPARSLGGGTEPGSAAPESRSRSAGPSSGEPLVSARSPEPVRARDRQPRRLPVRRPRRRTPVAAPRSATAVRGRRAMWGTA